MAKVTVFSTKGQRQVVVETEATTWGEFKKELVSKGIQVNGMQAVCRETKGIFKLDGAVLPKGLTSGDTVTNDWVLFLSPSKQTAGNSSQPMSYNELKDFIKSKRDTKEGKDFFGDYTHCTKEDLVDMVQEWKENHKRPSSPKRVAQPKVSQVVSEPEVGIEVQSNFGNETDKINKVFTLIQEAVEVMKTIPGVEDTAEFKKLDAEFAEVEFELTSC